MTRKQHPIRLQESWQTLSSTATQRCLLVRFKTHRRPGTVMSKAGSINVVRTSSASGTTVMVRLAGQLRRAWAPRADIGMALVERGERSSSCPMNSNEELKAIGVAYPTPANPIMLGNSDVT